MRGSWEPWISHMWNYHLARNPASAAGTTVCIFWRCRGTTNAVTLLLLLKLTWLTKQPVLQHKCTDILLSWRDKNWGWSYYIIIVFILYAWFFISFSLHLQRISFSSSPLLPPLPFSPFLFAFLLHHSFTPRGSVWVQGLLCTSLSTKLLFKRRTVYPLWWTLPHR